MQRFLILFVLIALFAQLPSTIMYQGKITNVEDIALNGFYSMSFELYLTEGDFEVLWSEDHPEVEVSRGLFNVELGTINPIELPFDSEYWLQITFDGDIMSPRQKLTSSAYSFRAKVADSLKGFGFTHGDTMVAYWDSLRNIPAAFSDGVDDVADSDTDPTNEIITAFNWDDESNVLSIAEGPMREVIDVTIINEADDLSDNSMADLSDVDFGIEFAEDGDGLVYDAGTWYPTPLNTDCFCWRKAYEVSGTYLYPDFGLAANDHLVIEEDGDVSIDRYPSDTARLHIRSVTDKFGVLIESEGTAGSEIGLHTANSEFSSLVKNAYFDGTSWQRFNTTGGAFLQEIVPGGGAYFKVVPSGANPISWTDVLTLKTSGNVGIGTTNPSEKLEVNGTAKVNILKIMGGSDLSERFEINSESQIEPGMIVCIDENNPGELKLSTDEYDKKVAGIVSGAGGVNPGMLMGQDGSIADGEYPIALTGRVYCYANASNGAITPGDMLTTSKIPGHAMKVTDYDKSHGAIIGKAMTSLESGKGLVLVLVSLQ